jgi:tetratricopeptide (TPR) repeat protein
MVGAVTTLAARLVSSTTRLGRKLGTCLGGAYAVTLLWSFAAAHAAPAAPPSTSSLQAPAAPPSTPLAPSSPPPAPPAPPPSAPPDGDMAEQQRRIGRAAVLHDEARALYQQGEYRAAIVSLKEAAQLDPEGKELVYNLAVIHEKLGEIDAAERYYRKYLEMLSQPKEREQVEAVLRRLQGARKELSRTAPAEPPLHPKVAAPRPTPPVVRPRRSAAVRQVSPWIFASGGVAAGALAVSNLFAILALARDPGSEARTGAGVTLADLQADAAAANRYAVVADVALVVAGLSSAAALSLYLATPSRASRVIKASVAAPALRSTSWPASRLDGGALSPPRGTRSPELQGGPLVGVSLGAGGVRLQVNF